MTAMAVKQDASHARFWEAGYWLDKTVDQLLTEAVARIPDKISIVADRADRAQSRRLTYRALDDLANASTEAAQKLRAACPTEIALTAATAGVRAIMYEDYGDTTVPDVATSVIRWSLEKGAASEVLRFHDGAVNAVVLLRGSKHRRPSTMKLMGMFTRPRGNTSRSARRRTTT